jgi:hypothetical protein
MKANKTLVFNGSKLQLFRAKTVTVYYVLRGKINVKCVASIAQSLEERNWETTV